MPSSSLLIRDVRIFDGQTDIPSGSVLVESGKISKVSSGQLEPIDASTIVLSKPGHTLIPGIVDGHIHAVGGDLVALTQAIKFGVTTVCDMHQEAGNVTKLRKAAEHPDAADYKTASQAATIKGGWPEAVVTRHNMSEELQHIVAGWPDIKNQDDVNAWIQARLEDKADYLKLMHEDGGALDVKPKLPKPELQKMLVKAAHDNGFRVVAHALSLDATIEILNAGVDGMTHTFFDKPPTKEVIEAYKKNNAHCNPTLATIGSLTAEGLAEQEVYAHDPRVRKLLGDANLIGMLCKCMSMSNEHSKVEYAYQSVRELKAAGIDIILGSDANSITYGTAIGSSAHHELALMVKKCGFTPAEALRAGTFLVSKRLGFVDRGRIAEGLRADLVLVEGNPLEDIDHTLNLRGVWKEGILISTFREILG